MQKNTIVAYVFCVHYFKNTTTEAYVGLRANQHFFSFFTGTAHCLQTVKCGASKLLQRGFTILSMNLDCKQ